MKASAGFANARALLAFMSGGADEVTIYADEGLDLSRHHDQTPGVRRSAAACAGSLRRAASCS